MINFFDSEWRDFATDTLKSSIEVQLEGFRHLESGWSVMNEGEPIPKDVIGRSCNLYFNLRNLNFDSFEVQPGLSGEVLLGAQRADNAVEIIVNQDIGHYEYYLENNGVEVVSKVDLSYRDLLQELKELSGWNTSEYSTQDIIKKENQDTQSWHSSLLPKMEVSQYLASSAPFRIVGKSVPTFRNTIAA